MILLCTNDSSSILFIGVYFKYFQGFSTCIPPLFSIVLCWAGKGSKLASWEFWLFWTHSCSTVNKYWATYIVSHPFLLKKKKKRTSPRAERTQGLNSANRPLSTGKKWTTLMPPVQNHNSNKNKILKKDARSSQSEISGASGTPVNAVLGRKTQAPCNSPLNSPDAAPARRARPPSPLPGGRNSGRHLKNHGGKGARGTARSRGLDPGVSGLLA